MKQKGFYPLYTTLGLVLVLIVLAITIQWGTQGARDFNAHVDRLTWLKINHAVDNVRSMASDSLKDVFQNAILDVGRIGDYTINPYLNHSEEEGWNLIVADLQVGVSGGFKEAIPKLADYSDGTYSEFVFDGGINVTIGELLPEDLEFVDTDEGLLARVQLPLTVTNRYEGWEASFSKTNITIPTGIRLKEMYKRAWDFNQHYEETVRWTFTGAIYARAYAAAYGSKEGAFLKEGHYDFDPIATVLFGDLDTTKSFLGDLDSVIDIGAVPAATWLAEWQYLSEPSFLPAGIDMESSDKDTTKNAIIGNYNMLEYEQGVCDNVSADQREDCESIYDLDNLQNEIGKVEIERDKFEDILDGLDDWFDNYDTSDYLYCEVCAEDLKKCISDCDDLPRTKQAGCIRRCNKKYPLCKVSEDCGDARTCCQQRVLDGMGLNRMTCDDFRDEANELISSIIKSFTKIDADACQNQIDTTIDLYGPYDLDTIDELVDNFKENNETYGFEETLEYCEFPANDIEALETIQDEKLSESDISDSKCVRFGEVGDCESDRDCEDGGDCGVSCDYPSCPSSAESYDCLADKEVYPSREVTCTVCETTGSGRRDCDRMTDRIDQCTCRCRASIDLLITINIYMLEIQEYVNKTYIALDKTYDTLDEQLKNREAINDLSEAVDELDANRDGFDVFSRIETGLVKYDKGEFVGGKLCYFNPVFETRNNGTCGDSVESVTLYTIQIAAAALASVLSGGLATPLLDYAKDFFPMVYESGVRFNLTETLIDDKNRIILKNMAGNGAELYTYAPFEFEIYRNREFDIGSATLDRIIVYMYLPAIKNGLQRVMDGLADESCGGEACG